MKIKKDYLEYSLNVNVKYLQTNDAVGDHWNWAYFVPLIVIGSQTGKTK